MVGTEVKRILEGANQFGRRRPLKRETGIFGDGSTGEKIAEALAFFAAETR